MRRGIECVGGPLDGHYVEEKEVNLVVTIGRGRPGRWYYYRQVEDGRYHFVSEYARDELDCDMARE